MKKILFSNHLIVLMLFFLPFIKENNANAQMISTYAGTGINGYTIPGALNASTSFSLIDALAMDPSGNIYVGSEENKIFKISTSGIISLYAGNGYFWASGDGGLATDAGISRPRKIIVDATGNLYFTTYNLSSIRKIDTAGIITTIAGTGVVGYSGDGGLATSALIGYPFGLAFDSSGNLYFSDGFLGAGQEGHYIRKIDMQTGIISTIAGNGNGGNAGNGGQAINAEIWANSIAIDPFDNLYIENIVGGGVRKINLATGVINNFAGNGAYGYAGDGASALLAQFGYIGDMNFDSAGNLYITEMSNSSNPDYDNNTIRKIDVNGIVTTVAGNGNSTYGFSGDGGSPTYAQMYHPVGFTVSTTGTEFYIADLGNYRIRKVDLLASPVCPNTFTITKTHYADGEVLITPIISPAFGTPNYTGTITGNPATNPLNTVIINTTSTHTEIFPGNGVYNLNLTYIDTISSFVCTRNVVDTISISNSLTPLSFNRRFEIISNTFCNAGTPYFKDSTVFQYGIPSGSALYTIVTNWGNGTITTDTVTATNQINIISSPTAYLNPGTYTVISILSGGGLPNDTIITSVNVQPCGDLSGILYNDVSNDCVMNGENLIVQNVPLKASNGTNTYFTWSNGGYFVFSNILAGTYTLEVLNTNTGYTTTCVNSLPHNTSVITLQNNFEMLPLNCAGGFDISITDISLYNGFTPGLTEYILPHIGVNNGSCDFVIPGEVRMILSPCLTYQVGGNLANAPDMVIPSATGDTLVWYVSDINNIGNFSYWNYPVLVSTCTSAVVGDTACIVMMVIPSNGDVNAANNIYTEYFMIGVSYDPNFKEVSPKGFGAEGYIPAQTPDLTYTLHFQNTGTAPAINVFLVDTLDANLDLYSIEILSSSHPMQPFLLPGGVMKFMFANINLPDSTNDEMHSHGYVKYRIKLNTGLTPGTEIKNKVLIYFDYNEPVITNTTLNTIEYLTSIKKNEAIDFDVFPNPTNHFLNINLTNNSIAKITITDLLGNEVLGFNSSKSQNILDVQTLQNGIYFLTILQDGNSMTKKICINR